MGLYKVLGKLGQSRRGRGRGKASSRLRHGGRRALSLESLEERSLLSVAPTVAGLAPASTGGSVVAGVSNVNVVKPALLNAPFAPTIALDASTDSNYPSDPSTLGDNITNVITPTFSGTATPGDTIDVFATTDFAGDQYVGTATADPVTGAWTAAWDPTFVSNLSDPGYYSAVDGRDTSTRTTRPPL